MLNTKFIIKRAMLEQLARERLADFAALKAAHRYVAAIYLGVYAIECLLKACICKALDLQDLPVTYKAHDLTALLLHSGLNSRIQTVPDVFDSLTMLDGLWNPERDDGNLRYALDPTRFDSAAADRVEKWLNDTNCGVATWLTSQL